MRARPLKRPAERGFLSAARFSGLVCYQATPSGVVDGKTATTVPQAPRAAGG